MSVVRETKNRDVLLWITSDPSANREVLEAAVLDFELKVHLSPPESLWQSMAAHPCAIVGFELEGPECLALVAEMSERMPSLTLFAASADADVATIRAALEAGASDFLSLPLDRQELHKALIKSSRHRAAVPASATAVMGEVVTVYGARGGLGATTLAVNLAVRLSALTGSNAGLLDLDLQRGDVATFMNLKPAQSLAAFAMAPGEVDVVFLQHTLARHPSGVYVLPAPQEIEEAELVAREHVETALRLLRSRFPHTVVDTARALSEATLAALEQTEHLLLLTDLSVPGVRAARRTLDLLSRLGSLAQNIHLLVTAENRESVKRDDAVRVLGKEPLMTIPRDELGAAHAMNTGAPLNGTRPSVLTDSISELARKLTGIAPEPSGGLRRLFGRRKGGR
jgi:pilus assembly protein CpaE